MARRFHKLTRPNLRNLKPGTQLCEHGITYEKLANGDGVFRVNIMEGKVRIHRTIGNESAGVTLETCISTIEQLRTEAREGRLNLPKGRKVMMGFEEAAGTYLENLRKTGGKGITDKSLRLRLHLVPFFSQTPLNQITTVLVDEYKASRLAGYSIKGGDWRSKKSQATHQHQGAKITQVSQATVNKELGVLSHLLSRAIDWGWLMQKPCKIVKYREDNQRIEYLTEDQMHTLLDTAKQDRHPEIYLFMLIGLSTGMRKMEILSIKVEEIDFGQRLIHIPKAKAGARPQPFPESMVLELKRYLRQSGIETGWLFPAEDSKTGHRMNLEKPFRRVVAAAGLDPKRVVRHTLRHTCITHLVQQGIDLPTVAVISGHRTLQMVQRYAHQNNAHVQAAFKKLEERLPAPKLPLERLRLNRKVVESQ